MANSNNISKNIYQLPFIGDIDIRPAPFHFENSLRKNAVDFALEVDTPILASENGLVHRIIDKHGDGKFDKKFLDKCNLVIIEHPNEEYSIYVHLKTGILVRKNQRIIAGQVIGFSGLSGYTGYPHLHYETAIQHSEDDWISIPTRFEIERKIKILVSPRE